MLHSAQFSLERLRTAAVLSVPNLVTFSTFSTFTSSIENLYNHYLALEVSASCLDLETFQVLLRTAGNTLQEPLLFVI